MRQITYTNTTLDTPFEALHCQHMSIHSTSMNRKIEPQGVAFSNDGTKMFVVGDAGPEINEYTLTTPFDLTAPPLAANNQIFSVSDQDTNTRRHGVLK